MAGIDLGGLPLWQNLALFLVTAAVIWVAGSRLAVYADIIAERTGLGHAFIGLVLLASATSLPEIGRTISAASFGDAPLVVDSLLGGVVFQTSILALADFVMGKDRVLTFFAPRAVLLLEGALVVALLALALAGIAAGPLVHLFDVSIWTALLFAAYLLSLYLLKGYEASDSWLPTEVPVQLERAELERLGAARGPRGRSTRTIALLFGGASVVIFAAGVFLAQVGEVLATQTGLGASFVGATLLAVAAALPELSTTTAAVRFGAYSLAFSNIFGTNAQLVALLFLGDLFYRQGPILEAVGRSSVFAASMGILVTSVYLVGLIGRRRRAFLGMGLDSAVVLAFYIVTLAVLYVLT